MRRFDYNDDEDREVNDFFDDNDDDDYEGLSPEDEKELYEQQMALVYRDMNDRLLLRATKMLEKSFWWKFYSLDTRLAMIQKTYKRYLDLVLQDDEGE